MSQMSSAKFILPPPQLQAVIDKTASFIAKNGMAFQERIMEAEQSTKFSFLLNDDPYYKYFEYTLNLIKQGQLPESLIQKEQELDDLVIKPDEPPPLKYLTDIGDMNRMDLDVIKLAAKYTALYGQSFHLQLMQKESNNFRFNFLRPTNTKHGVYQSYVDQLKYINENSAETESFIKNVQKNPLCLLPQIMQRTEYLQYLQFEARVENEKQDNLRELYDSIDWHDYEVIEHVQFSIADSIETYPPPLTLSRLKTMSIEEKQNQLKDLQQAMTKIEHEISNEQPRVESSVEDNLSVEMDISDVELPETNLNVKQPRALPKNVHVVLVSCPRCGLKANDLEMEKHIKSCLHDPRHEEQIKRYQEKNAISNIADDDEIARNIQGRNVIIENKADLIWDGKQHTRQKIIEESKKRKHQDTIIEQSKDRFDVIIQMPMGAGKFQDICKGETITLEISTKQKIIDIKHMISEKTKLPWAKIKLYKETLLLKNAMNLTELHENDVLNVRI
eukprot:NODE_315_length_11202_cov_0.258849.p2 type:complete len:503 gc:universal NODE_315_length_11202_cov_0.258849:7437-8945(+)